MHTSSRPYASTPDQRLMAMAQRDDSIAFAELHRRHGAAVLALTRRITGGGAIAEDALQEAFLAIWRYRHAYRPERGGVRGWMLSIAHNRTIDLLRKDQRHRRPVGDDGSLLEQQVAPERTDVQVMTREDARTIRHGLKALPTEQASSIALAYYGGLTHAEIGRLGDVPLGTVKGRIRSGLTKLRVHAELAPQAA